MSRNSSEKKKGARLQRFWLVARKFFFFFGDGMWRLDVDSLWLHTVRFVSETIKGFIAHDCGLHAAALTYFSLLALVPMLCLTLLLAKTCGVDDYARNQINLRLDEMIANVENGQKDVPEMLASNEKTMEEKRQSAAEFGRTAREISNVLLDRVERFDAGTLGWVGLAFLVWTVISTLSSVETACNKIWRVTKPRPIWKKMYLYVFVSIVLPILVAVALSMPVMERLLWVIDNTVGATERMRYIADIIKMALSSRLFSFLFMLFFSTCSFAFFFKFMPNTKVRLRPAFEGGFITALLFAAWMWICAVAQVGIAKASALYGSFAFLPIVLAWVYMSWQIVLLGEVMVYSFQCVHARERVNFKRLRA